MDDEFTLTGTGTGLVMDPTGEAPFDISSVMVAANANDLLSAEDLKILDQLDRFTPITDIQTLPDAVEIPEVPVDVLRDADEANAAIEAERQVEVEAQAPAVSTGTDPEAEMWKLLAPRAVDTPVEGQTAITSDCKNSGFFDPEDPAASLAAAVATVEAINMMPEPRALPQSPEEAIAAVDGLIGSPEDIPHFAPETVAPAAASAPVVPTPEPTAPVAPEPVAEAVAAPTMQEVMEAQLGATPEMYEPDEETIAPELQAITDAVEDDVHEAIIAQEENDDRKIIIGKSQSGPSGVFAGFLANAALGGDAPVVDTHHDLHAVDNRFVDDPNFSIESKAPAKVGSVAAMHIPADIPNIIGMLDELSAIDINMKLNIPLILVGHTGLAKTTVIAKKHEEMKWPYRSVTMNGSVEVDTLVGKWTANPKEGMVYKLGILPFCMKYGIALGIQEINFLLPEVLVLLHEFADEGHITLMDLDPTHPDYIIRPHENFRLYGTMNPPELYAGARDLSPALARRCIVKRVDELTDVQEQRVVIEQSHVEADVARSLQTVGKSVRESFDMGKTLYYLSTADLIMWGRLMVAGGLDALTAAKLAIMGKAAPSDHDFLLNVIRLQFEPGYHPAASPTPAYPQY